MPICSTVTEEPQNWCVCRILSPPLFSLQISHLYIARFKPRISLPTLILVVRIPAGPTTSAGCWQDPLALSCRGLPRSFSHAENRRLQRCCTEHSGQIKLRFPAFAETHANKRRFSSKEVCNWSKTNGPKLIALISAKMDVCSNSVA